ERHVQPQKRARVRLHSVGAVEPTCQLLALVRFGESSVFQQEESLSESLNEVRGREAIAVEEARALDLERRRALQTQRREKPKDERCTLLHKRLTRFHE